MGTKNEPMFNCDWQVCDVCGDEFKGRKATVCYDCQKRNQRDERKILDPMDRILFKIKKYFKKEMQITIDRDTEVKNEKIS